MHYLRCGNELNITYRHKSNKLNKRHSNVRVLINESIMQIYSTALSCSVTECSLFRGLSVNGTPIFFTAFVPLAPTFHCFLYFSLSCFFLFLSLFLTILQCKFYSI